MIGRTLSHYRITAAIGAGGMGEVYRATDTSLGRDVAIKVLPPEVRDDPDRLARFRREARVLASLSHPNIASIYGLEEADGTPFLAMELAEGEDLKDRLARGAMPVDEAIDVAEQIAEALEEAHGKGIVHRDLKPGNVKLTPDGKVKVLDFGLAKALSADGGGALPDPGSGPGGALSQSPTITSPAMTQLGVILGTAAYMSPEQARGRPIDKRSDVWAFGVLVWEMLTGRTLFGGETVTDVIAAVVTHAPDLDALPSSTPPAVRRLLERCLRKDPRQRLPDIGAARLELQEAHTDSEVSRAAAGAPGDGPRPAPAGRRRWLPWALGASTLVLFGLLLPLAIVHFGEDAPARPPAGLFAFHPPAGWVFRTWGVPLPSPDGSQIVFQAVPEGTLTGAEAAATVLWTRPLTSLSSRLLPGTEGAEFPFWSPDGRYVGFFAGRELRRLDLASGTVQRIAAVPGTPNSGYGGADWGEDGTILFATGDLQPNTVYRVAATGGEPDLVLDGGAAGVAATPQWLPGQRAYAAFLMGVGTDPTGMYSVDLGPPGRRQVLMEASGASLRFQVVGDRAFYTRDGTLLSQPYDQGTRRVTGEAVAMASSVGSWNGNPDFGWFGASRAGTLAYRADEPGGGDVQLTWVDRHGNPVGRIGEPGRYGQIALSSDGRKVAVEIQTDDTGFDIWVMDAARGVPSRVTAGSEDERNPVWLPDGSSLSFSVLHDGQTDIRRKGLRAGDPDTVIVDTDMHDYPEAWSSDGRVLLFVRRTALTNAAGQSIWMAHPGTDAPPTAVVDNGFYVDEPQISPDGRWVAYNSQESGRSEVYVEPWQRAGERVRVSVDGGGQPKWRQDGAELFFIALDGRLMTVTTRVAGGRVDVALPVPLFEIGGFEGPDYDDYAPDADGQRFLVKRPLETSPRPEMRVLINWMSLLD